MQTYSVFVYGTLRKGGTYHHFLKNARLLKENYLLPGFRLYDYRHWYPYMVKGNKEDVVTGEIYKVDEAGLQLLNQLEDVENQLYSLVYLPGHRFYTYLKFDHQVSGLHFIPEGDWIQYVKRLIG